MILADTSAWIEYDRATGSAIHLRLRDLVAEGGALIVTEPVAMEVLAGARDDFGELRLRRLLGRFELARFDAGVDFETATRIYRTCRQRGITPRGFVDCLIAAVAMRHGAAVLAHDGDFRAIASVMALRLDPATGPAATLG